MANRNSRSISRLGVIVTVYQIIVYFEGEEPQSNCLCFPAFEITLQKRWKTEYVCLCEPEDSYTQICLFSFSTKEAPIRPNRNNTHSPRRLLTDEGVPLR